MCRLGMAWHCKHTSFGSEYKMMSTSTKERMYCKMPLKMKYLRARAARVSGVAGYKGSGVGRCLTYSEQQINSSPLFTGNSHEVSIFS